MTIALLDSRRAARIARNIDAPEAPILEEIAHLRAGRASEMHRFAELCDRYDNLYYPDNIHKNGGADHWPDHPSAKIDGRVHVSLNIYPAYVDIPASLQSVEPIENILATKPEDPAMRDLAGSVERVYFAWKEKDHFELNSHKACVVKGLYGRTASKVYWDEEKGYPCVQVIDQPRFLTLGWSNNDYTRLDWVIYSYAISPNEAIEHYGVEVSATELTEDVGPDKGKVVRLPFIRRPGSGGDHADPLNQANPGMHTRGWLDNNFMIECVDYWYRRPVEGSERTLGKRTPMETWNAVVVGNVLVKDMKHEEYEGQLPYVPLFNTYIPGVPNGRSDFYDIEQIIREKEERLSSGGQMIHKAIMGQYWQLVGPEAPDEVPAGVTPKENETIAPGPGNRVEKIEPFIPEFQLEQYLARLDRELVDVSGLNDLLRGLAPASVMSSSKAINALVANYEARIRMRRDLFYLWRSANWEMVKLVWGNKNAVLKAAFETTAPIDIKAPSITPRDDLETATLALNLLNGKAWSLARVQDYTGVDDPEGEQDIIRKERTDASLFPADVQTIAALMATMQQLGMQQQMMGQQNAANQAQASRQAQEGGYLGQPQMNGTGEQAMIPPSGMPMNAQPGGLPPSGPSENFLAQTAIQEGAPQNRLLLQQPIAPEEEGASGGGY